MRGARTNRGWWVLAGVVALASWGAVELSAQADPLDPARVPALALAEVVRIGGDDAREDYVFQSVRHALVRGPDAVVVLDGGSREARTYGLDGVLRSKVGGKGQGPGEFQTVWRAATLPDGRLLVFDRWPLHVTAFDGDGTVAFTSTPTAGAQAMPLFADFAGALSDGSWIQRVNKNPMDLRDEPEGPRRDTIRFTRIATDGTVSGPVAALPGPLRHLMKSGKAWGDETPIFGRELVAATRGDTLLVGLTDELRLLRFAPDGTALPPLSAPRPAREATRRLVGAARAERVAVLEARAARPPSSSMPFDMSEMLRSEIETAKKVPAEETVPAYADLLVGSDGVLWVRAYRMPGEAKTERWFRMGADFRPDGRIDVPGDGRLLAAGHGLLVTVVKDELDVETVVVHRVR